MELLYYLQKKSWPWDIPQDIWTDTYSRSCGGGVSFGDNCKVISNPNLNPTCGEGKTHLSVWSDGEIVIGNNVGMSLVSITSANSIKIEDNVLIGAGTKIWDTDFHPVNYDDRSNKGIGLSAPVLIEEGCFIGADVIILKGVTIGRHSVIGAGSVVTKSVPENEVWAGNPARFIRKIQEREEE